jgi:hypothetical protein
MAHGCSDNVDFLNLSFQTENPSKINVNENKQSLEKPILVNFIEDERLL